MTELLNPFCPVTETVKLLVLPAVPVIVPGDTAMEKSGVGTVKDSAAECASDPDVPFTVTLYVPGVAVLGIEKVTV